METISREYLKSQIDNLTHLITLYEGARQFATHLLEELSEVDPADGSIDENKQHDGA